MPGTRSRRRRFRATENSSPMRYMAQDADSEIVVRNVATRN